MPINDAIVDGLSGGSAVVGSHAQPSALAARGGRFERHADGWSSSDGGTRYRSAVGLSATAVDSARGKPWQQWSLDRARKVWQLYDGTAAAEQYARIARVKQRGRVLDGPGLTRGRGSKYRGIGGFPCGTYSACKTEQRYYSDGLKVVLHLDEPAGPRIDPSLYCLWSYS